MRHETATSLRGEAWGTACGHTPALNKILSGRHEHEHGCLPKKGFSYLTDSSAPLLFVWFYIRGATGFWAFWGFFVDQ